MRLALLNLTGKGGVSGGYRRYLERLLPIFDEKIGSGAILCATPAGVPVRDWAGPVKRTEFADCLPFSPLTGADESLKKRVAEFRPDVIFVPIERHFYYPGVPVVSMVLNMAPMAANYEPGQLSERLRHVFQRYCARKAVKNSAHVFAPSRFVKEYLTGHWGLAPDAVTVVYPGAEKTDGLALARPAAIPPAWDKFLWTIGSVERYRGLEDLFSALLEKGLEEARLVICGAARGPMKAYHAELKRKAEELGLGGRLIWVQGLTEGEITWCYRNCAAFVMTSRIEAGPNTALEALSAGSVCIAADNPPLPEFFGATALYYPPGDGAALAGRIKTALGWDAPGRAERSQAARARAAEFSWQTAADRMFELFEKLAPGAGRV
ncbi:MAG: hypothetical protein A2089_11525 [Elusimicrobia bacterium GWD2_63_28]|nr:MAG: hypothetical protein A2089_11525 [Elusimicrobia bacterium GWD2_63_28]